MRIGPFALGWLLGIKSRSGFKGVLVVCHLELSQSKEKARASVSWLRQELALPALTFASGSGPALP